MFRVYWGNSRRAGALGYYSERKREEKKIKWSQQQQQQQSQLLPNDMYIYTDVICS
jgi:hypothetical protein